MYTNTPAYKLTCAVCKKPVDRWVTQEDRMTGLKSWTAYCHGQVDKMVLDPMQFTFEQLKEFEHQAQTGGAVAFRSELREEWGGDRLAGYTLLIDGAQKAAFSTEFMEAMARHPKIGTVVLSTKENLNDQS